MMRGKIMRSKNTTSSKPAFESNTKKEKMTPEEIQAHMREGREGLTASASKEVYREAQKLGIA